MAICTMDPLPFLTTRWGMTSIQSMRIGSLFSGIGGLELGLERSGLGTTSWQVEIDPVARSVLAHHWPRAQRFESVVGLDPPPCEILCGGFPCQDLSSANVAGRRGLDGAKSGLWVEFSRIIGIASPQIVVVENVGRNWSSWVPFVRRDLWSRGYSSVPLRLSPAHLGYPHHRDRVFLVAYPHSDSECLRQLHAKASSITKASSSFGQGTWQQAYQVVARPDGLPRGLARLPGNAVVPAVAEIIGRAILDSRVGEARVGQVVGVLPSRQ